MAGESGDEKRRRLLIPPFLTPETFREGREERDRPREKRIRIRRVGAIDKGMAKINGRLATETGLKDMVEVIVAGGSSRERRFVLSLIIDDSVPDNELWCNDLFLKEQGVADNSIVTIRPYAE